MVLCGRVRRLPLAVTPAVVRGSGLPSGLIAGAGVLSSGAIGRMRDAAAARLPLLAADGQPDGGPGRDSAGRQGYRGSRSWLRDLLTRTSLLPGPGSHGYSP